jgi:phosphoribosylglycinamide formyltransferase-1
LISGGGTTLQNFIDRIGDGTLNASIVAVVSSSAKAYGLVRAESAGLPTFVFARREWPTASNEVFAVMRRSNVDLVACAGFLKRLSIPPDFINRVVNIHPSLIPQFCGAGYYGSRVHEAVLASGVRETGCTVHLVDDEYDHGQILLRRVVPVSPDDTAESIARRVFEAECVAYPAAIKAWRLRFGDALSRTDSVR